MKRFALLCLLVATAAQSCKDHFDDRADQWQSASLPFVGVHSNLVICEDDTDWYRAFVLPQQTLRVIVETEQRPITDLQLSMHSDSGSANKLLDGIVSGSALRATFINALSDVQSVLFRVGSLTTNDVHYRMTISCSGCLQGLWLNKNDDQPNMLRFPVRTLADGRYEYRTQWGENPQDRKRKRNIALPEQNTAPVRPRRQRAKRAVLQAFCDIDTLVCPDGYTRHLALESGQCKFVDCPSHRNYGCTRTWEYWLSTYERGGILPNNSAERSLCGRSWTQWLERTHTSDDTVFHLVVLEYIAARLNTAAGADAHRIYKEMLEMAKLLLTHCPDIYDNDPSIPQWSEDDSQDAWDLQRDLASFNAGDKGPPSCSTLNRIDNPNFGVEGNRYSFLAMWNENIPTQLTTQPPRTTPPAPLPTPGFSGAWPTSPVPVAQLGAPEVIPQGSFWYITLDEPSNGLYRLPEQNFDARGWSANPAPFHYGESELAARGSVFTYDVEDQWYRQTFTVSPQQLAQCFGVELSVASDNGADVWINGYLLIQDNDDHEYRYWNHQGTFPTAVLRVGINVITAHNRNNAGSSDTVFDARVLLKYSPSIIVSSAPAPTPRRTNRPTPAPLPPSPNFPWPTPQTPTPVHVPVPSDDEQCLDGQSALGFTPHDFGNVGPDVDFLIGTLTHYNCPILGPSVTALELAVPITLNALGQSTRVARFTLRLDETVNTPVLADCEYPSLVSCADRLWWPSLSTADSWVLGDTRYTLQLKGFSKKPDPSQYTPVENFISEEGLRNNAFLIARIVSAPFCATAFDECGICGGDGKSCAPIGCDGVQGSGLQYDRCDVCDGDDLCVDCSGRVNGGRVYDECDVCGGDGTSCRGCDGVPNSGKRVDRCGVCGGNGLSCVDCAGIPNGTRVLDNCGVCGGDGLSCDQTFDCQGRLRGSAQYDRCDVCSGDGMSCVDCFLVPFGTATYDACDVCNGTGSSCIDCAGVPNGTTERDECGVCGGNNESCQGCNGVPHSIFVYDACGNCGHPNQPLTCVSGCDTRPYAPYKEFDLCGVCGGTNSCVDCEGMPHGNAQYDRCDVCNGFDECVDCMDVPYGRATYNICGVCEEPHEGVPAGNCISGCDRRPWSTLEFDRCGVCGGDGLSCVDCAGQVNGKLVYDVCDVCGGDGSSCSDCTGKVGGSAQYDRCDVCGGNGQSCVDCYGIPYGRGERDLCGVCGGRNESCTDCAGNVKGDHYYNQCDVCVSSSDEGIALDCLDCRGLPFGTWVYDQCDVCVSSVEVQSRKRFSCVDCAGTPYGDHIYNVCDECVSPDEARKRSLTCIDCAGTVFGSASYDRCDVCNGDGSSCKGVTEEFLTWSSQLTSKTAQLTEAPQTSSGILPLTTRTTTLTSTAGDPETTAIDDASTTTITTTTTKLQAATTTAAAATTTTTTSTTKAITREATTDPLFTTSTNVRVIGVDDSDGARGNGDQLGPDDVVSDNNGGQQPATSAGMAVVIGVLVLLAIAGLLAAGFMYYRYKQTRPLYVGAQNPTLETPI